MADRTPVIVGVGLSDYPKEPELDNVAHHGLAIRRALDDSGVKLPDIDGLMCFGSYGVDDAPTVAEIFGIKYRVLDGTFVGGTVFEYFVHHAAAAIRTGQADTVLISYGSALLSSQGRNLGTQMFTSGARQAGPLQYEVPWGNPLIGSYAMAAKRHMHEYGTTSEQLAQIAVDIRDNASHNPKALYQKPITVDDVMSSRLIADPLHMLDCCVISDGGGAVIMTTAERAADLPSTPVYIAGSATAQTHWNISQMPDFTSTAAAISGPAAFAEAGITHADVDTLQLYDSFTITTLLLLEGLGFCAKGEGGPFVGRGGVLRFDGELPTNTDGGGLSSCHPGMRGVFLLIESVRQLRGQAGDVQVPDCEVAVACGSGGFLSAMGTVVLTKEKR